MPSSSCCLDCALFLLKWQKKIEFITAVYGQSGNQMVGYLCNHLTNHSEVELYIWGATSVYRLCGDKLLLQTSQAFEKSHHSLSRFQLVLTSNSTLPYYVSCNRWDLRPRMTEDTLPGNIVETFFNYVKNSGRAYWSKIKMPRLLTDHFCLYNQTHLWISLIFCSV